MVSLISLVADEIVSCRLCWPLRELRPFNKRSSAMDVAIEAALPRGVKGKEGIRRCVRDYVEGVLEVCPRVCQCMG